MTRHGMCQIFVLSLCLSLAISTGGSLAQPKPPVAIVEDMTANVTKIPHFHLLRVGDVLDLASDQGIIISYIESCRRENIRGGEVRIGQAESTVQGGKVQHQIVPCDPLALDLTPEQASQSAALAFRDPDEPAAGDPVAAEAAFAMASRLPLVLAPDIAELVVEDRRTGRIWRRQATDGLFTLAGDGTLLERGGVYRISGGGRSLVFRIGREASGAPLPLLKRLIRF